MFAVMTGQYEGAATLLAAGARVDLTSLLLQSTKDSGLGSRGLPEIGVQLNEYL